MIKGKYLLITTLIMIVIVTISTLLQVNVSDSKRENIKQFIYATDVDTSDVYVKIELDDLEESIKQEEVVALVALQGVGEKKLDEEIKKIEAKKLEEIAEKERLDANKAKLTYNPFEKSNLTVKQYNNILKGTGLEGAGQSFYKMEQTYNVNGMFAVSVALHESGLGRHRVNTNNFFGMRGSKGWMAFDSVDANIQYFGELMNRNSYKGKDIVNIGKVYCPGTYDSWASRVTWFMTNYFERR